MTKQLLAYHGDPAIKQRLLEAIRADQAADAIMQGVYTRRHGNAVGFVGCAMGCAVQAFRGAQALDGELNWHEALEQDAGIAAQMNFIIEGMSITGADRLEITKLAGQKLVSVWDRSNEDELWMVYESGAAVVHVSGKIGDPWSLKYSSPERTKIVIANEWKQARDLVDAVVPLLDFFKLEVDS